MTWISNPILFAAWLAACIRSKTAQITAFCLSLTALLIAASFSLDHVVTVMIDEGNGLAKDPITGYAAGYWFWLASMAIAIIVTVRGVRMALTLSMTGKWRCF